MLKADDPRKKPANAHCAYLGRVDCSRRFFGPRPLCAPGGWDRRHVTLRQAVHMSNPSVRLLIMTLIIWHENSAHWMKQQLPLSKS